MAGRELLTIKYSLRLWLGCIRSKSTSHPKQQQTLGQPNLNLLEKELEEKPFTPPFSRAKVGPFFQEEPRLENSYLGDAFLRRWIKRVIPADVLHNIEPDLQCFGARVATDLYRLGRDCELNQPYLRQFDAWGNRVDEVVTCDAWKMMKQVSAEEGLIALAYERSHGEWSRLHQLVKLFFFHPSSGLYSCPLAMTDGAARTIEAMNLDGLKGAFKHLTSRNPKEFWTSGQWMTERRGGSDVANGTETLAIPQSDGTYRLYGYKWFSSATDADMSLTLARIVDENGNTVKGTKGLSLFFLETRDSLKRLNNIQVMRLKNKLGTRQLPTGELLLDGAVAKLASADGRGVASIANMLNITRVHNAVASVSAMRRVLSLARDYSNRRTAFQMTLRDYPLHMLTLADMEVETRGGTALILEISRLLGLEETRKSSDKDNLLLRLLTPISKLYTAKRAMAVISEGLECFGGQGYIEDTGLPSLFRDAQVTPIWEGTTNILSLDVLRALAKTKGELLLAWEQHVNESLKEAENHLRLSRAAGRVQQALLETLEFVQQNSDPQLLQLAARDLAFSVAHITIGGLLLEHASWEGASPSDLTTALRWCERDLSPVNIKHQHGLYYSQPEAEATSELVFDGYDPAHLLDKLS